MVTFSGPMTAGSHIPPACVVPFDLAANGYVAEEFLASGTACGYELDGEVRHDGRWTARPADTAEYRTRIVVRRPADPGRFSGTLLLEWLNVSSGFDADADWGYLHEEILRAGHAYAAVSVQALGVMGGHSLLGFPGEFPGLRQSDPDRYGSLVHPGDKYAFDIFSQIGRALGGRAGPGGGREPGGGSVPGGGREPVEVLGGLAPSRVLALGESQSGYFLTSYINAVQSSSPVFDGFFVHSRGAGAALLSGGGLDLENVTVGVRIRDDTAVPVLMIQAEGDLAPPLASALARQPDSERFRLWEVAGTAHADAYLIGEAAALLGCDWRINEGPHRYVAQAALHALHRWACGEAPPASAAWIELTSQDPPAIARDAHGIALGGVRTPLVDVPVAVLSGEGPPGAAGPGWLVGSTVPFPGQALRELYGDEAGYLDAYTRSLDAAIEAGFLLPAHREQLLAQARAVSFETA